LETPVEQFLRNSHFPGLAREGRKAKNYVLLFDNSVSDLFLRRLAAFAAQPSTTAALLDVAVSQRKIVQQAARFCG
jgi:hypothetical protein